MGSSKRYFQKQPCPTKLLSTWDCIQTNSAHYRLCPKVISEYNSVQPYPCPFRTLSKPPSSVHQRICPNVIPKSNSVQLFPCPPRALSKPTLPITDSVHQRVCPNLISEFHSVQTYPCPSRALSKPASSVHQR